MILNFNYDTASKAIEELAGKGYTIDFNLEEIKPDCKFNWPDFSITGIYRYEGDSDPADEMIIYALSSTTGLKGVLISGYGISYDDRAHSVLKKLNNNITI